MKITLEKTDDKEIQIIIRGNVAGEEVGRILELLRSANKITKMLLYKDEEQFLVEVQDIVYMEAFNNKVFVYTNKDTYETKLKLYELQEKLYSNGFCQISKSVIVNINHVRSVQAEFSGNYIARLKEKKEKLTISRKYIKDFKNSIMEVK